MELRVLYAKEIIALLLIFNSLLIALIIIRKQMIKFFFSWLWFVWENLYKSNFFFFYFFIDSWPLSCVIGDFGIFKHWKFFFFYFIIIGQVLSLGLRIGFFLIDLSFSCKLDVYFLNTYRNTILRENYFTYINVFFFYLNRLHITCISRSSWDYFC